MKKSIKITLSFCLFVFGTKGLYSQSNTVSAGGQATGAGGSISYSIGQINYNTTTGGGITISEGLQSAYEISTVTGIEEKNINLSASVYPNPSTGFLILNVEDNKIENYTYQIIDIQGKIIISNKLEKNQTNISIAELTNASYYINVLNNNKPIKQFKIIKTN